MKLKLFTAALFFSVVFYSYAQDIPPAPDNKAVVYFVRTSSLGFAINFSYFDSAVFLGKANGQNYIRYECEPGAHLFWARSENRSFVEAEVEAGKIYFLEVTPELGAIKAQVSLKPADPSNEKQMQRILKVIKKKSPETFTAEQLQEETKKEIIDRGLEKYKDDKEKGKTVPKLEKTAYYKPM